MQSRPLSTPAGRRNQRAPGALAMRVSDYAASGKQPLGVADAVGVSACAGECADLAGRL